MSTWKKYGGLSHVEAQNSISAYSLSVDLFTLRQAYFGTFDICGELHVSGNALVDHDVRPNNITVKNDISCNQLFVKSNSNHLGDMFVTGNLSVLSGNVRIMNGNIDLSHNLYLSKQLFLGNSGLYINGTDISGNIGINTMAPKSALDFQSSKPFMLNLETTNPVNYSVLSKTAGADGLVVYADASTSRLDFFVDASLNVGSTPDARLAYTPGGNFTIDVSSNTAILSNVSLSNRSNQTIAHVYGETAVIYDNSAGFYQYPVYQNSALVTGNALTLVANDASSITFLNMVTPDKKGMAIGGGAYPNNTTRAMGTIGLLDTSGNYAPSVHLVDASSNVYRKFGLGINTYAPELDSYTLNINGPTHMKNGQLTITLQPNIEIYKMSLASPNSNYGIAIGSPYTTDASFTDPTYKYRQKVYYTTNGGEIWTDNSVDVTNGLYNTSIEQAVSGAPRYINGIFAYDASLSFLCANGIINYSNSSGAKWYGISNISGTQNYASIYAISTRVFAADTTGNLLYLNYTSGIYTDYNGVPAGSPTTLSIGYTGSPVLHGYGTQLFLAAGNSVFQLNNISGTVSFSLKFTNSYGPYRSIYTLDGFNAVAVGNSVITWTNNGFSTHTDINVPGTTFNDIHIIDASNAIAVGNSGVVQYTTNGYATWKTVPLAILNSSGNGNVLTNLAYNLTTVKCIDINQFYITKKISSYVSATTFGNTSLFHCYVPELFNNTNNHVLDISGSAFLSGDLNVNDGGRIRTNNSAFYLLDTCANIIRMGGEASSVFIGNSASSTTTVNSSLVTKQDASFNGNVVIGGKTQMLGNTTFTNSYVFSSYFDSANTDGSIYIAGLNSSQLGLPVNPGARNVKIGNFNPTVDMSCNIYIGGASDSIILGGSVYDNSSLNIGPQLYINYLSFSNSSPHCGLYIGESSVKGAGYVIVSNDMGGFVVKSTKSPNIIKLDVSNLIYNGTSGYNQGIVTLSKLTQGIGVDASYSVGVGTIDVSNVFLKNWALSSVSSNLQTVDTSMSILGNVAIGKSTFIVNTKLDISGNVLVSSRLGVGNTVVNGSYVFDVLGDTNLGGNANVTGIVSAMGNVAVNRSTATAGYAVDVSGNTNLTGNLVVSNGAKITSGNVALYSGNLCINRALSNIGYALDVSGNANVSGNLTVANGIALNGGGISATSAQTINFGTNAPTMYGNNIALATILPASINGLSSAIPGINSTGTVGLNKSSASAGYALDISGNTNVSGNLIVSKGLSASTTQTINFGTNAPTMYGNNIASGTVPDAALTSNVMLLNNYQAVTSTKAFNIPTGTDYLQMVNTQTSGQVGYLYVNSASTIGYYSTTSTSILWSINYTGKFTTGGGITATSTQTINFGTNAPTMYGNNIANGTIPDAALTSNIPKLNASNTFTTLQVLNTPLSDSINVRNNAAGQTNGYFYVNNISQTGYWNGSSQNWYITSSGDIFTIGNINASTSGRTINFGTNAPTMYGTNIASGTVPDAALTSNVMLLNFPQVITSTKYFEVTGNSDHVQFYNNNTSGQAGYIYINTANTIGYYSSTSTSILWAITYDGTATIPKPIFPNNVSINTQSTYNVLATQSGHTFYVYGDVSTAFTLPSPNKCFYIFINGNTLNSITVTCATNGGFFLPYSVGTQTITLPPNTTATIRGDGYNWLLIESSFRNNITGINSTGSVGINKSSASTGYVLDVSGNVSINSPRLLNFNLYNKSSTFNYSAAGLSLTGTSTMYLDASRGYVFSFNGSSYYKINVSPVTTPTTTLSMWIYYTGQTTKNILDTTWWPNYYNASGRFTSNVYYTGGGPVLTESTTKTINTWHHYVVTINSLFATLYVDGVLDTSANFSSYYGSPGSGWYRISPSSPNYSNDGLLVGGGGAGTVLPSSPIGFGSSTNFVGYLDDVRIYNNLALSPSQVQSLYLNGGPNYVLNVTGDTNINGNLTVSSGFTVGSGIVTFPAGSISPSAISGGVSVAGINSTGNVGINKSSASAGYALDVNGNAYVSGNLTVNNGFTVSSGTVSFPSSSISPASINNLSTAIPGINSTGTIGVNKVLSNSGYVLDTSGSAFISQGIWVGPPLTYINIAITPTSSTYSTSDNNIFGFTSLGTINISKTNTVLNIPAGSLSNNSFTYTPFTYEGNYTFTYTYNYSTLSDSPNMYIYPNSTPSGYGTQYFLGQVNGLSGTISTTIYLSNGLNGGLFAAAFGNVVYGTAISQTLSIKFQPTLSSTSFTYINSRLGVGNGLYINKAVITSGYALDVNGNVLATSYHSSSDARLKTHVQPLLSTFDTIQKINAVSFDWKGNGKSDCGFIAQNVFEHLPNMRPDNWSADEPVDASGNTIYYSIDYSKMTPHLWGAVHDLIKDNRRLNQENASLKKRIERIEAALGLVL